MPVTIKKIRGAWRVVEAEGGQPARGRGGAPVDGGGHRDPDDARRQAAAINHAQRQRDA